MTTPRQCHFGERAVYSVSSSCIRAFAGLDESIRRPNLALYVREVTEANVPPLCGTAAIPVAPSSICFFCVCTSSITAK